MNRRRVLPVLAGLAVAAGLASYTVVRRRPASDALAASGAVEATDAALGFQLAGRIASIRPREGDRVKAGDTLATLDSPELVARRAQAQAQVAAARATLAELRAGARSEEIAQAREAARAADERLADAQRDADRMQQLAKNGTVSRQSYDKAKLARDVAESQRNQARQQLQLMESGPRQERVRAQQAAVEQAEAVVRQADATLANTVLRAPFDALVTVRDREPGEVVGAGMPVVTVVNMQDRWVRIFIREDRVGAVHIGQTASVTADSYPGKRYTGQVAFIASEAEFTPRNVQTTEERVKLVYAVKVRITGDPGLELKPGMPADVTLAP